jgi:hypothetical protein
MFKSLFNFERNTPPYNHIVQIGDPVSNFNKLYKNSTCTHFVLFLKVLREVSDPVPPECIRKF